MVDNNDSPGGSKLSTTPKAQPKNCPCLSNKPGKVVWINCCNNDCNIKHWHASCAGIKKPKQTLINDIGEWLCPLCTITNIPSINSPSEETIKQISQTINNDMNELIKTEVKNEIEEVKRQLLVEMGALRSLMTAQLSKLDQCDKNVTDKVINVGTDMQQKIQSYAEKVSEKMNETSSGLQTIKIMNKNVEGLKTNFENKTATETEDKMEEKRKKIKEKNVCVYCVPESDSTEEKDAYQDDINKIRKILDGKVELQKKDLVEIYRTKKKENQTNARPIIIRFNDINKKKEILKLRKLSYNGTNIFISPDRTQKQQEVHKKLVTELKARKEQGEEDIFIVDERIVKFQESSRTSSKSYLNSCNF